MKRFMNVLKFVIISCFALSGLTGCTGCVGTVCPPGKTVIILHADGSSDIVDKGVYKYWGRDKLYFVDGRLKGFKEPMKILCEDDINMDVDVKATMCFQVQKESIDFIKSKVKPKRIEQGDVAGFELSLDEFYMMVVSDIVRGTSRNIISKYMTDDIRPNREKIEADIDAGIRKRLSELKYPIHVSAILLSNIDYPQSVTDTRQRIKQAQLKDQEQAALAEARLAEAQRQVAIEQELAKVRMVKAQAQADENTILTTSLTPEFLMWRQFEVMELTAARLAEGQSNTVFMMPYATMNQKSEAKRS